ncbi:MAG: 3-phosphoserine/phosphohydroxythreonine transaminase [Saprospiraceae bacterium]|nr:3-phosphoserine/phosphohydroxythreonine transaminase [Saprospiraceae bacterium]
MKYNFYAGPAILPHEVIEEAAKAVLDFNGMEFSILEISHRSKEFIAVMDEAVALVKELMHIGDEHEVLFLSGGASSQFYMAPMNILDETEKAAYVDTGTWASKAINDGKLYGHVDVIASSKDKNYNYIPKGYTIDPSYKYVHLTSNNTIFGTQYKSFPETSVPFVCDMSSDIFSRVIDVNKFDLIYAGAQKNMGPAGTTLVIVRKSILGKVSRKIPAMLKYTNHIEAGSMYNTPPVFPVYVSMLTLRWIKKNGGVSGIQKMNEAKAAALYNEIDRNPLFFCPNETEDRSNMNICFLLKDSELEKDFLTKCKEAGCIGLEGHRSVGGFRASTYNAMSMEGIQQLIGVMKEFEKNNG